MTAATSADTALDNQIEGKSARQVFQMGRTAERNLDRWQAIEYFQRAFEMAPDDAEICFHLALNLDLVGEEDEALSLYEQACSKTPVPVNALLNLSVLYDDAGEYAKAQRCLKTVLDTDPNHVRARLYMKDVVASTTMYYHEPGQRLRDHQSGLLETPITDFELSVRARNCLKKMNIRTLGDLLRISEAELMAYKNFGEATLMEIKSMLSDKGLRIGAALMQQQQMTREEIFQQLVDTAGEDAIGVLGQSVDDLDLSVRARKALSLLNISTIGDLVARTEAELLGIKNFGQTSLDEIKEKLGERGLSLRQLDDA